MNDIVKISDIAEELGLSTATVSNVIHGKTNKVSNKTIKRVQELIQQRAYIPNMAGILLAQNNSRIIGVVINDHEKYEGHIFEDGYISSAINALSKQIDRSGYFMMIRTTTKWDDIVRFASMWNMDGLVIMGFCEQDYQKLRENMHIPFIVYDGYFKETKGISNLIIDNYDGGYQVGMYLKSLGHKKVLCISDNYICMDAERIDGCRDAMGEDMATYLKIPMQKEERIRLYQKNIDEFLKYTAVFAVSDFYALELLTLLQNNGIKVPEDISIIGFDDSPLCHYCNPTLTTVKQDVNERAIFALKLMQDLRIKTEQKITIKLPVLLVERGSTRKMN